MQNSEIPAAAPAGTSPLNFDLISALIFSVPKLDAQRILHIGKTRLYELLGLGLLDGVKNGQRTEITIESIKRYQASLKRVTFKAPASPRLEALDQLHAKQRQLAAQRRAKRAQRHRSKARGE
jgi:hypothetical protein